VNELSATVHQLEAYVQEELDLQNRLLAALREQESALFHGDLAQIAANVERFDAQLSGAPARAARRHDLLRRLAAQFGVAANTLTLSSICTRLGADGERLARNSASLRAATQDVATVTRRLSALARMHVRLNNDLLGAVLAGGEGHAPALERCGALLDAQA
jgi:hypothetical protein